MYHIVTFYIIKLQEKTLLTCRLYSQKKKKERELWIYKFRDNRVMNLIKTGLYRNDFSNHYYIGSTYNLKKKKKEVESRKLRCL